MTDALNKVNTGNINNMVKLAPLPGGGVWGEALLTYKSVLTTLTVQKYHWLSRLIQKLSRYQSSYIYLQ